MRLEHTVGSLAAGTRNTLLRIRRVWPDAPTLVRKPAVARHWLLSARPALIGFAVLAVVFPTLMPGAVDALLEMIYPPIQHKEFFGLLNNTYQDPRLETRQLQIKVLLWVLGFVSVSLMFWLHIPRAIASAATIAEDREQQADGRLAEDPGQSIMLYRSALALSPDSAQEARLQNKLDALAQRPSSSGSTIEQTQVLSVDTPAVHRSQRVGPDGRYLLERELGRGAMGVVYQARDQVLDRDVALKELPVHLAADPLQKERFQQEARALARLAHAHIVQVYDMIIEPARAFIAMELVEGQDLDSRLGSGEKLSPSETLSIAIALTDAMTYAHARGVIHRDFKPANILLTADLQAKISDFGLAKIARSSVETQAGTVMGSPGYMSPEQAAGKSIDERTDIYSLGVTLYKMIAGEVPFTGDAGSVMAQHITQSPPPLAERNPRCPEALKALIMQMLAKEPADRPPSMQAVRKRLQTIKVS